MCYSTEITYIYCWMLTRGFSNPISLLDTYGSWKGKDHLSYASFCASSQKRDTPNHTRAKNVHRRWNSQENLVMITTMVAASSVGIRDFGNDGNGFQLFWPRIPKLERLLDSTGKRNQSLISCRAQNSVLNVQSCLTCYCEHRCLVEASMPATIVCYEASKEARLLCSSE